MAWFTDLIPSMLIGDAGDPSGVQNARKTEEAQAAFFGSLCALPPVPNEDIDRLARVTASKIEDTKGGKLA
jgi:hypothetical protein